MVEPVTGVTTPLRLRPSFDQLVERARRLVAAAAADSARGRRILGLTGPPGAGKSTLAQAIVGALAGEAEYLPMDGFHLATAELRRLGREDRKGAPDTFDGAGFVELLRRIGTPAPDVVYAPAFNRSIEDAIAGSIAIEAAVPLVVTEGNYLLLDVGPWSRIRGLVDEVWYLDQVSERRIRRLVDRHVWFGRDRLEAEAWVQRSDEANAALVATTRERADLLVEVDPI